MERGICPIAAQTVTFRLPRISVCGYIIYGCILHQKVAQYAQNPEVKGLPYKDFEILTIKCIEVTTSTYEHHL